MGAGVSIIEFYSAGQPITVSLGVSRTTAVHHSIRFGN